MYYVRCEQPGCTFDALDKEFDVVADAFSDHQFEEHAVWPAGTCSRISQARRTSVSFIP